MFLGGHHVLIPRGDPSVSKVFETAYLRLNGLTYSGRISTDNTCAVGACF